MKFVFALILALSGCASVSAQVKEVVTTTAPGKLLPYNAQEFGNVYQSNENALAALSEGDTIVFEWKRKTSAPEIVQKKYQVREKLGEGLVTQVFALANDPNKVLRMPRSWDFVDTEEFPYPTFLNYMMKGYAILREKGVPVVRIYDYRPLLYMVVDRISGPNLLEFLTQPESFTSVQREKMLRDLIDFTRRSIAFTAFGDFHYEQILYDKNRGWVLFDWTNDHKMAEVKKDLQSNFFESTDVQYDNLSAQAEQHIRDWYEYVSKLISFTTHNERMAVWYKEPRENFRPMSEYIKKSTALTCEAIFR